MKIALAQMEVRPGRPDINTKVMLNMIKRAKKNKADMIIFPEMAVPGYLLGDIWERQSFLLDCENYGKQVIDASDELIILFGNVAVDWQKRGDDGRVRKYNAFFTAQNGKLVGGDNFPYPFRIKTLLPNYREFDDERHFYSLRKLAQDLDCSPEDLLRPVYVQYKGKKLGLGCTICEDGWNEEYSINPISLISKNGKTDLFINISSSPFTLGKNNKRHRNFSRHARETGVPLIYVNNVGIQNNGKTVYTFDGSSTVYNSCGNVVYFCSRPFEQSMDIVDLDTATGAVNLPRLKVPNDDNITYIYQAIIYGIKKFTASIGVSKVVIGISGGIDSAVTAALYCQALGAGNILLVNMPNIYNSKTTRNLSLKLAKNLKCLYTVLPIQKSVEQTIKQIENTPVINYQNNKKTYFKLNSLIEENIQARDRSSRILAALSAAFGGVFTCNANKAELTVGYSTLYGDQAGFLAALADLWKHQVYQLADYINEEVYQQQIIPQEIIDLPPSAELSFAQSVDEGKGDPIIYPYHDYLFRSFVERWDRATPEDILEWYQAGILEKKIGCKPGLVGEVFATPADFIADLEKWWRLYNGIALAKRIQAPPVLAVSRRAFGFDHRESQVGEYYSQRYYRLKEKILTY
ncbi:NAD+ synthase (glutamine-hydrolyzing) [Desulfohalotomaculum tongense]|uniref:NAD(+) synthase n=1 Tax=Desulforadius tongensis TaxID=1216062 RepID=UPI0023676A9C|nr:NAD(+) synthase [Desulforadius tongensis]MBM7855281.1 NAD+ synthase (glutamine-hydrolyzing) [Desulforadius tongensis]